jgi:hypothetical protein
MVRPSGPGVTSEMTWTTVAAQAEQWVPDPSVPRRRHDDVPAQRKIVTPILDQIGQRTLVREVYLASRAECDAWAEAQRADGFEVEDPVEAHNGWRASGKIGYTDAGHGADCWLIRARKPADG